MAVKRRLKGNKMVTSRYKDGLKLWQQQRQAQKKTSSPIRETTGFEIQTRDMPMHPKRASF